MAMKKTVEDTGGNTAEAREDMYMPNWREKVGDRRQIRYYSKIKMIPGLSEEERRELEVTEKVFEFRANSYYLSLIDWDDPEDPIRRLIIPHPDELLDDSPLDASHEAAVTVAPGLEHKYTRTAVILYSNVCSSICRFCFRKRIFQPGNAEISPDLGPALAYIREHKEIDNVLITGGDPLVLSTRKVEYILEELRKIPHVKIIRLGTRMLAFNPFRFIDDPELMAILERNSYENAKIYFVVQFNHPREITSYAIQAANMLQKRGMHMIHQTPILAGINDKVETIVELWDRLARIGIQPYYIFQCRPTRGNAHFKLSFVDAVDLIEKARAEVSGLSKRARFAGSHASGKIEILGYDDEWQYFRYHQAKEDKWYGQFFKLPRNNEATWWDDWMPDGESFTLETCPVVKLGSGSR